jgi:malate dehydrogenase
VPITDVTNVTIWGNHSATQYPDVYRTRIGGRPAAEVIGDDAWVEKEFIPTVQQRGAAIIEARGASSAASAGSAAIDHIHDWMLGTAPGDWISMGICSDGSYGVPEGLISSFPVTAADGAYRVVPDLDLDEFSRTRIDASVSELGEERDAVRELGLIS